MVFVVAECGVNWIVDRTDRLKMARRMIEVFKECGADACKFQMFQEYHIAKHPRAAELKNLVLTEKDVKELMEYGITCDIEVFFTPMYPEAVDILEKCNVNRYKVRALDAMNTSLLKKVLMTKKDTLISVANDRLDWNTLEECESKYRARLLYCVARYPAKDLEMHLKVAFPAMRAYISSVEYAGLSDHTVGITCAIAAAAMGAQVIEKHVKLDSGYDWIDNDVAINAIEFKEMAYHIRRVEELRK